VEKLASVSLSLSLTLSLKHTHARTHTRTRKHTNILSLRMYATNICVTSEGKTHTICLFHSHTHSHTCTRIFSLRVEMKHMFFSEHMCPRSVFPSKRVYTSRFTVRTNVFHICDDDDVAAAAETKRKTNGFRKKTHSRVLKCINCFFFLFQSIYNQINSLFMVCDRRNAVFKPYSSCVTFGIRLQSLIKPSK